MEDPKSFSDRIKNMHSKELYDYMQEEFSAALKKIVTENATPTPDNPIEFETDKGKFKYDGEGNLYVQPNKSLEYIKIDIEIKPSKHNENNPKEN